MTAQIWTIANVAAELHMVGRTIRSDRAAAARATARLCLRTDCDDHHTDRTWSRPTAPRPAYTAHLNVR